MINCLPNYKFLNEQISVYRQRNSSVTHTMNDGHLKNYLWIIQKYVDYNFDNRIKKSAKSYLAFQYMLLLAHSSKISKEEKKDFIKELKKYQYLFKYNINPRVNKISKIYNIFGFNITRFLLCNYLKRK